jgi:hypothetical protein
VLIPGCRKPAERLNASQAGRDQGLAPHVGGAPRGTCRDMESFRPEQTDPIPLRRTPHRMGTIMIRFCGLLAIAVVLLALIYSR